MPNEMYTNTGHVFDTSKAMYCTLVYVLGSFRYLKCLKDEFEMFVE